VQDVGSAEVATTPAVDTVTRIVSGHAVAVVVIQNGRTCWVAGQ
jgi:hypothetical protein